MKQNTPSTLAYTSVAVIGLLPVSDVYAHDTVTFNCAATNNVIVHRLVNKEGLNVALSVKDCVLLIILRNSITYVTYDDYIFWNPSVCYTNISDR